jgi:hypothetical protein
MLSLKIIQIIHQRFNQYILKRAQKITYIFNTFYSQINLELS